VRRKKGAVVYFLIAAGSKLIPPYYGVAEHKKKSKVFLPRISFASWFVVGEKHTYTNRSIATVRYQHCPRKREKVEKQLQIRKI
jgi:hypothetical protein